MGGKKIKSTEAMKRGLALEDSVLSVVEGIVGSKLKKTGLHLLPCWPIFGASPDAINRDTIVEIKCPQSEKTLPNYIGRGGQVGRKFLAQMHLQMLLTGRKKGLFCVADPKFETNSIVHIAHVTYNDKYASELLSLSLKFWKTNIFPKLLATICPAN